MQYLEDFPGCRAKLPKLWPLAREGGVGLDCQKKTFLKTGEASEGRFEQPTLLRKIDKTSSDSPPPGRCKNQGLKW